MPRLVEIAAFFQFFNVPLELRNYLLFFFAVAGKGAFICVDNSLSSFKVNPPNLSISESIVPWSSVGSVALSFKLRKPCAAWQL